ncbi:hypothetical protein PABG_12461 [Paracoccidioides brasiliensis Pb03]|nr:hypothetical protein PABG_12461 [Paracoccidioides brasiliensis Pb03]
MRPAATGSSPPVGSILVLGRWLSPKMGGALTGGAKSAEPPSTPGSWALAPGTESDSGRGHGPRQQPTNRAGNTHAPTHPRTHPYIQTTPAPAPPHPHPALLPGRRKIRWWRCHRPEETTE